MYLPHLPFHPGSWVSQLHPHPEPAGTDGTRWLTYKFCNQTAERLPNSAPWSPEIYSKMSQVPLRDEVGGETYTSSRIAQLLLTSHLTFWTRFVWKGSSITKRKSIKVQDGETSPLERDLADTWRKWVTGTSFAIDWSKSLNPSGTPFLICTTRRPCINMGQVLVVTVP
jgi:hypothetical protein